MLSNYMFARVESRVGVSATISALKRCSIRLDFYLVCRGFMFYLYFTYTILVSNVTSISDDVRVVLQ